MFYSEDDDFMSDDEPRMFPEFINMLNSGKYSSIDELCNEEGINHDELFMDEDDLDIDLDCYPKGLMDEGSDSSAIILGTLAGTVILAGAAYVGKKIYDKSKNKVTKNIK